ncbi:Uma2 family endonuclease [Nocardia sp. NPDC052566]|uniref:Uma2 family endonuclease n=1 Tax=Nocardia sp. NPDC052566 TaxID=3364330 RepID=UPI0037C6C75E
MVTVVHWPDHLLTLEDWNALPGDNSRSYELVEGVLVVSPRPVAKHQRACWRLAAQLEPQLPLNYAALTESEVVIEPTSPSTVRVPDVIVIPTAGVDDNVPRSAAADVLLAVEILSVGTKRTDQVTKFAEYADVGIEHYWLVDLDDPVSMAAYRLIEGEYELVGEGSGQMVLDVADTSITVDLMRLLSRRG